MMRALVLAAFCAFAAAAQTATPAPAPASAAISNLPSYTVGIGPSWTRGGNAPYAVDFTVGVHLGQSSWYSWTTVSTPVNLPVIPNAPPAPSTITTGGAWVPVQSATGSVSLIFIVQAGFSAASVTSSAAPAFTGTGALAIRLAPGLYLMPYAKAANASTSASSGALATAVFQPGLQIMYAFGGK